DRLSVVDGDHLEGHPLLDRVAALDDALDGDVQVVTLDLREEADVAEVDTEQRDTRAAGQLGGSQDRPVAAEDADELAAGRGVVGVGHHRVRVTLQRGAEYLLWKGRDRDAGRGEPLDHPE